MALAAGALAAATRGEIGLDEALAVIDGLRRLGELRRPLEEEARMRRIDDKLALLREMMAGTPPERLPGPAKRLLAEVGPWVSAPPDRDNDGW